VALVAALRVTSKSSDVKILKTARKKVRFFFAIRTNCRTFVPYSL
jgi:hypothetical protein